MSEKIYIGAGKEKKFDGGGSSIKILLELDGMKEHWEKYGFLSESGKHMLKIDVNSRKEVSQAGYTHYIILDTWKPDSADDYKPAEDQNQKNDESGDDSIPF